MRIPKPRKRLEASIEDACVAYARGKRFMSRKMNGVGFRSWPDRLFVGPPSAMGTFWVEFKRRDEEPTEAQVDLHGDLRARGEEIWVCDDVAEFKERLDNWMATHALDP